MNIEASSKLKDVVVKNKLKDKDVIIGIRPEIMEDIKLRSRIRKEINHNKQGRGG
jgi:hypothetical protein